MRSNKEIIIRQKCNSKSAFDHEALKIIRERIKIFATRHHSLLCYSHLLIDRLYEKETEQSGHHKTDSLYKTVAQLQNGVEALGKEFLLDQIFLNDFIILKLNSLALMARTKMLCANTEELKEAARKQYLDIFILLNDYLPLLEYKNEITFQKEMHDCFQNITIWEGEKLIEIDTSFDPEVLVFHFSLQCADPIMKLNMQYMPVVRTVNHHKSINNKLITKNEYIEVFENFSLSCENLLKENKLDLEGRIRYINANILIRDFYIAIHPTLRKIDIDKALQEKKREFLTRYFKIYDDLNEQYLKKALTLTDGINLSDAIIDDIAEARRFGKIILYDLYNHIVRLSTWNKFLDGNLDQIDTETSRKLILKTYKFLIQLSSFFDKFFQKFPDTKHRPGKLSRSFLRPCNDFQKELFNIAEINELIDQFTRSEIIRDQLFLEEKQRKLKISEESARILVELENKQKQRWQQRKARPEKITIQKINQEKSENSEDDTETSIKPQLSKSELYLYSAHQMLEKHKLNNAINLYEKAYAQAIADTDLLYQSYALDGLASTCGNILLKKLARLNSILEHRTQSISPYLPTQLSDLESTIIDIATRLEHLEDLLKKLVFLFPQLDQSHEQNDFTYAKTLIDNMIEHAKQLIDNTKARYSQIKEKSRKERYEFLVLLGKNGAPHLDVKKDRKKLHDLGLKKFIAIGKEKQRQNLDVSKYAAENDFWDEMGDYFSWVFEFPKKLLAISAGKSAKHPGLMDIHAQPSRNKMVRSIMKIALPDYMKQIFSKFNKLNPVLSGDALIKLISGNIHSPKEIELITSCNNASEISSAGFVVINPDHFFMEFNNCRINLLRIHEDIFSFKSKSIFTITSLFCLPEGDCGIIHDLSGKGLRDTDRMRLALLNESSAKDLTSDPLEILSFIERLLNGFYFDLNIKRAFEKVDTIPIHDEASFNSSVKEQLTQLDYPGRKKYLKLFLQFDLLKKLFDIDYEYQIHKAVADLEKKYNVPSVMIAKNQMGMFSTRDDNTKQHLLYSAKLSL